jgi:8-oxo-dGTP pyrophosphatase MutT (NUDIX family)
VIHRPARLVVPVVGVPVAFRPVTRPPRIRKAVAYVVRDGQLLVFRHRDVDVAVAGIQVPAGTIREGEEPADAVLREATEETGLAALKVVRALGTDDYDVRPGRYEVHERHFFQLTTVEPIEDEWLWFEAHDGLAEPTAFVCSWIPLHRAHVLAAGFGARIGAMSD